MVITQLWLVASGNFAWLNWLTILLGCSVIDTSSLAAVLIVPSRPVLDDPPLWFAVLVIVLAVLTLTLSYWPVRNMISRRQRMNMSFNPFHLVNTYGAFGSISRIRQEVVIEGTDEASITDETVWKEYDFRGKPGRLRDMPRQWAPYHLRLDWLMWFAAISPQYAYSWFRPLMLRLLRNDAATLRLLRGNPFPDAPPCFVRARLYRYRFTTAAELRRDHAWWHRTLEGEYLRPVSVSDVTTPSG